MGIHLVVEGGCREGKNAAAAFAHGVAQGRYTVVEGGGEGWWLKTRAAIVPKECADGMRWR